MGYYGLYLEFPSLSVLPTTHTKINENKAGYMIPLIYNCGGYDVVIQKSTTLALGTKSQWKVKNSETKNSRNTRTKAVKRVYKLKAEPTPQSEELSAREALENTAFVG